VRLGVLTGAFASYSSSLELQGGGLLACWRPHAFEEKYFGTSHVMRRQPLSSAPTTLQESDALHAGELRMDSHDHIERHGVARIMSRFCLEPIPM
jgi:hypothetical protein